MQEMIRNRVRELLAESAGDRVLGVSFSAA